jgi:hypothetical protein
MFLIYASCKNESEAGYFVSIQGAIKCPIIIVSTPKEIPRSNAIL